MNERDEFDERLRAALREEDAALLASIEHEQGMHELLRAGLRGPTAWWVILVSVVQVVLFGAVVWAAVGFVQAAQVDDRVWWGVWLVLAWTAVGTIKLMVWGHVERTVLRRELKRVELLVATLATRAQSR